MFGTLCVQQNEERYETKLRKLTGLVDKLENIKRLNGKWVDVARRMNDS